MNRFERAVYDCMKPTAKLLEQTTKPLHRAILLNFWRHVHLEGAGDYEKSCRQTWWWITPSTASPGARTLP